MKAILLVKEMKLGVIGREPGVQCFTQFQPWSSPLNEMLANIPGLLESGWEAGGRLTTMSEGASEVVDNHANRNVLRAGTEKIGAVDTHIVIVKDENLDIDRCPGGRQRFFKGAEKRRSVEVVAEFSCEGQGKTKFVEMRFKCLRAGLGRSGKGNCGRSL